jgi:1-aminocyclopropane-1-carboxylate deaminase/D-cysteine desulfhydrase-like pyridoxal-dependent ACC family enzyme
VLARDAKSTPVQGNLLLDYILGAEVRLVEAPGPGSGLNEIKREVGEEYRALGYNPFIIAPPLSETLGAVAYADCLLEICDQLHERGIQADTLVVCSAGATQSGLVLANKATGAGLKIIGIAPIRWPYDTATAMADTANRAAGRLGLTITVEPGEVHNTDDYVGEAYGVVTTEGVEALRLMARTEGIILDPSYTAKALAGLIDLAHQGQIESDATVIFLHTGGTPAVFAYAEELV